MAHETNVDECHCAILHNIEVLNTPRDWHVLLLRSGDEKEEPMESTTTQFPPQALSTEAVNGSGLGSSRTVLNILKHAVIRTSYIDGACLCEAGRIGYRLDESFPNYVRIGLAHADAQRVRF